ncbi:U32 family peptidase [Agaribacterium haliotis]|uniref:U32 family peptidase n=1 Tax=Agaribacterium haliotis TaxID=2013869 RepID=UPI000BB5528A|nr:U32 family peptidase [Agaribacterium haliotis]
MKMTLAPIPFFWPKDTVLAFYEEAALWPVERIVIGETICSKRREMRTEDWKDLALRLSKSGKDVALSSLALIESESEYNSIKSLALDGVGLEANDLGAAEIFHQQQHLFSAGHFLNIYNIECLKLLHQDGLRRWTLPVELGKKELEQFSSAINEHKLDIQTELFAHGYLPLALSARCFTARTLDKPKDRCEKICLDYPQGIAVDSQEGQRLFTVNGIQTLSGKLVDLVDKIAELKQLGLDSVRLSPSCFDMTDIIDSYQRAIDGEHVESVCDNYCNGYWHGREGMATELSELAALN